MANTSHLLPTYAPAGFVPERAQGSTLWDDSGRDYIDLGSGIAVTALGHSHPQIVKALQQQSNKIWHLSNWMVNQPELDLAALLCERTFAEQVFFSNSGAEANEGALKMARRFQSHRGAGDKTQIIAFEGAFHGRTLFTVSVGGKPAYTEGFGPLPGGIAHAPLNNLDAVRALLENAPTAAIIVEPVQGENGVLPCDSDFLRGLRGLCDEFDALLIFDEVQTGMGRTGSLYMYQQIEGVTPDILTTAKALGSGFPIGATLTRSAIGDCMQPGSHGSTFGGNPLACSVALRTLQLMDDELLAGVAERSRIFTDFLRQLGDNHRLFGAIRHAGLLIGAELGPDWSDRSMDLVHLGWKHGVLLLPAGPSVLRLAPALNISTEEIQEGLQRLSTAVDEFVGG